MTFRNGIRLFFAIVLLGLLAGRGLDAVADIERTTEPVGDYVLPMPAGKVLLVVDGAISYRNSPTEARFDETLINSLPRASLQTTTSVTDGVRLFEGPLMRDLLGLIGARGTVLKATALNNYTVDIPITDFYKYDVLLATHMDGLSLQDTGKGPFWIVYPRDQQRELQDIRYDYRWVWQLSHITLQ